MDRFATVFLAPPTPRASPTNTPPPLRQFDSCPAPWTLRLAQPSTSHAFTEAKRTQERNKRDEPSPPLLDLDLDDDFLTNKPYLIVAPSNYTLISASSFFTLVRTDSLCGDSCTSESLYIIRLITCGPLSGPPITMAEHVLPATPVILSV
ncbi:uncharacterized protein ARMOST_18158 [Armillaria ostoyae]|uniref:Uncharacterized protein n=1 Tax=Armillaria ostoyae TaxID=47428 RepID=A0A284S0Z8_ARMOS|nr:uncharacterized protein ARMOST_18158 [Armillaria ostoyae]